MSNLDKLKNNFNSIISDQDLNICRCDAEDLIEYYENVLNERVGRNISENDIIIEANLNNELFEARMIYKEIMDLINN